MSPETKRLRLRILGAPCATCIAPIRRELKSTKGVHWIGANVAADLILVDYDTSVLDAQGILDAVKRAGYTAVPLG